jgi:hypothetical protein
MSRVWLNIATSTSTRAAGFVLRQPSWVTRVALIAAVAIILALLAILVIPALLIGGAVLVLLSGVAKVRALLTRAHSPNGALDGRRNVRVISRQ